MTSFLDFMRERFGTTWGIAPRLTTGLQRRGYTVALSQKRYRDLETEWAEGAADAIRPTLGEAEIRALLIEDIIGHGPISMARLDRNERKTA